MIVIQSIEIPIHGLDGVEAMEEVSSYYPMFFSQVDDGPTYRQYLHMAAQILEGDVPSADELLNQYVWSVTLDGFLLRERNYRWHVLGDRSPMSAMA